MKTKDVSDKSPIDSYSIDRNQALQVVARLARKNEYDSANEMLGIIERSIKEDKEKLATTNMVRFRSEEEYGVFEQARRRAEENF